MTPSKAFRMKTLIVARRNNLKKPVLMMESTNVLTHSTDESNEQADFRLAHSLCNEHVVRNWGSCESTASVRSALSIDFVAVGARKAVVILEPVPDITQLEIILQVCQAVVIRAGRSGLHGDDRNYHWVPNHFLMNTI